MATKAQTKANKENSKKSTGPKTPKGKATASQNAVKHGLFGHEAVVNGEDREQFDLYRDALMADVRPIGATELMLAERFISLSWRLRRTERMQNQAIDEMIEDLKPWPIDQYIFWNTAVYLRTNERKFRVPEPKVALGRVAQRDCEGDRVLDRMMMYERRIESSMIRTMNQLKKLQIMRRIEQGAIVEEQSARQMSPAANHRGDLKKQSQFNPSLTGTMSSAIKDYGNKILAGVGENKANQSQFHPPAAPKGVGKRERSPGALAR
jgi:hypothetical protein